MPKHVSLNDRLRTATGSNVRAASDRIVATLNRARPTDIEAGARWYADGELFVDSQASLHNVSREHVAAVVAHLSPRTTWARNMAGAAAMLAGAEPQHCMSRNVQAAERALSSDRPLKTLNGPKVQRFAANLLGDREVVTVDVWAARVALGNRPDLDLLMGRVGVYDALEHAFQTAARRLGIDPVTAQATAWVVARNGRSD